MSAKTRDLAPLPAHPASLTRCRARATHEALALADARVAWGGFCPRLRSLGGPHFFVIGETGSGKTILLKLLMYSVLSDKEYDLRYRSLVFDPKGEFLPFLARCGVPPHAIILTNPLDARCSAWDISADITDRADASALAEAIVPTTSPTGDALQGDHLFWNQASNQVVRHVIDGFNARCPGAWDLRDIVLACMNAQHLQTILSLTYAGSCTAKQFLLADKKLAGNVLATLAAVMSPLELVANLWHHASSRFSIRDWASGSGVLLLSGSKDHAEITRVANNMLVRSAIQMVLSKPEDTSGDYTWFFLDELRQAGRFPNFSSLLNESRSKGGRVVLASQNKSGLNAAFGKDEANEVVGSCDNQIILSLGSEEDAKWASSMFSETYVDTRSTTIGGDSLSRTTKDELRPLVEPITFRQLPLASQCGGAVSGFGSMAGGFWYQVALSAPQVDELMPPRLDRDPPTFVRRDAEHLHTEPWSGSDFRRLSMHPGDHADSRSVEPRRFRQPDPWEEDRNQPSAEKRQP